jgi:hypothetical protein
VQMRFPYMELPSHAAKFVERKMTPVVPVQPSPQPALVVVEEAEPVMLRKSPQPVQKKQEQQPAEVNEQHPYFE